MGTTLHMHADPSSAKQFRSNAMVSFNSSGGKQTFSVAVDSYCNFLRVSTARTKTGLSRVCVSILIKKSYENLDIFQIGFVLFVVMGWVLTLLTFNHLQK